MAAPDSRSGDAGLRARPPIALADTGSRTRALDALQGSHGNQAVQRLIDVQRDEDEWSLDTPLGSVDVSYDPSTGSIRGSVDTGAGGASATYNTETGSATGAAGGGHYSAAGSYAADTGEVSGSVASARDSASGSYNTETGSGSGEVTTPSGSGSGSYDAGTGEVTGAVAVGGYGASGSYNTRGEDQASAQGSATKASPAGLSSGRDEDVPRATQGQAGPARPTLARGSQGRMVGDLQQRLIGAGFPCGAADGIFGPKTQRAVVAFQEANGLAADGIAGRRTWAALGA
ncbi:MAG: peptidoglycan-binding protein [Chloroflexi bacterium]|nr:peptidoglycan-binding protein [Chloroflexota bacterium]